MCTNYIQNLLDGSSDKLLGSRVKLDGVETGGFIPFGRYVVHNCYGTCFHTTSYEPNKHGILHSIVVKLRERQEEMIILSML